MGKLFNWDSPVIQAMSKVADLIILNILVVLCSIPIVTIGATQTALYDVTGKILRKEERIWKDYWRAFRSNFKQATILWLLLLVVGAPGLYALLFYFSVESSVSAVALAAVCMVLFLWNGTLAWVFPLQSRFENPIQYTLRNSLYCAVIYMPRTLAMMVLNTLPWVLFFCALPWFVWLGPLWLCIWFSLTSYLNMRLLKKPFAVLEELANNVGEKK